MVEELYANIRFATARDILTALVDVSE